MAGVAAFSLSPGRNFGSTFFAPNFGDRPPGEDRLLRLQNFVLACDTQVGLYGSEFRPVHVPSNAPQVGGG